MTKRSFSLSTQIMLSFLIIAIVVTSTLSTVFLNRLNETLLQDLKESAEVTMKYIDADIQYALASSYALTDSVASFANELEPTQLQEILINNVEINPAAFEMYYGTAISYWQLGGYFVAATGWEPQKPWDHISRPWFITATENPQQTVITEPYVDSDTGKMCVTISRSVHDATTGEIDGVVGTDVYLDVLNDIVTSQKLSENGETFLIDNNGMYIVHSDQTLL